MSQQINGSPELFTVRNALILGNFGSCISNAAEAKITNDEVKIERDILLYRAHIGLGQYELVLSEIKNEKETPIGLRAVRLLASYLNGNEENRKQCVEELEKWLSDPVLMTDVTLLIIAANIYTYEGNYISAIQCVYEASNLEMAATLISSYLRINRVDLAEQALQKMIKMNDEATLTQLSTAYVNLAQGGEKLQDAETILQILIEKYGETVLLLNAKAVCYMKMKRFSEANNALMSALSKRSQDPETLINLIVCAQHLKKSQELINRYVSQLKTTSPNHPWVKDLIASESQFEECANKYIK